METGGEGGGGKKRKKMSFFSLSSPSLALLSRERFSRRNHSVASRSFFGCNFFPFFPPATPVSELFVLLRQLASSGELFVFFSLLATWEILERLVLEQRAGESERKRERESGRRRRSSRRQGCAFLINVDIVVNSRSSS